MNPTPEPEAGIAEVAARLTKAQQEALFRVGDDLIDAREIDEEAGQELFNLGLISAISAAGYRFTDATEDGKSVLKHLARAQGED